MTTHPTDAPTDAAPEHRDGDLLDWLGFTPGTSDDRPLLIWAQPAGWPTALRAPRVLHRALRPRTA